MKKSVLYILAFILSNVLIAQSDSLSIFGTVTDIYGEALPFVNVTLLKDNEEVMGTTTDLNGEYEFKSIFKGQYKLNISMMCYEEKGKKEITISEGPVEQNIIIDSNTFRERGIVKQKKNSTVTKLK